jgi:hypothetical protein
LDCRHVCKTCAFHDALQAGKHKEVHRTPLICRLPAGDRSGEYLSVPPSRVKGSKKNLPLKMIMMG